ncbi:hypothetical protein I4U23_010994 [Adineta vaga]|nr:hypothetical protein I4U23_010994 [Adineta vaga]
MVTTHTDNNTSTIMGSAALLYINHVKQKARLSMNIDVQNWAMAANNDFIIICPSKSFCLINAEGIIVRKIDHELDEINDMCWSLYLNKFLILSEGILYGLDMTDSTQSQLLQIKTFKYSSITFTVSNEKFMISHDGIGSVIKLYNLSDWNLMSTFRPPISCQSHQEICKIRFNSDGTRVGLILTEYRNNCWFELRRAENMKLLKTVPFTDKYSHNLLSLPVGEFLLVPWDNKKLFLIDNNGKLKQTIDYDCKSIMYATLLNNRCLILQVMNDDLSSQELRFHDL